MQDEDMPQPAPHGLDSVAVGGELVKALRDQPDFLANVLGADTPYDFGLIPTVGDVDYATSGMPAPSASEADIYIVPKDYVEERGRFTAGYLALEANNDVESEIQVKGFLSPEGPVIRSVVSDTFDRAEHPSPDSRRHVRYAAEFADGVVFDHQLSVNPEQSYDMYVGMASGRLYDLETEKPLDVSLVSRDTLDAVRMALGDSDSGIVTVRADLIHNPSQEASRDPVRRMEVLDANPDESTIELEWRSLMAIREVVREDFRTGIEKSFLVSGVDMMNSSLNEVVDYAPARHVDRLMPGAGAQIEDNGTYAKLNTVIPPLEAGTGEVRPTSAYAIVDIHLGLDPVVSAAVVKADRITTVGLAESKTHDVVSRTAKGEATHVAEDRVETSVSLLAQGGRLYAAVDDYYSDDGWKRVGGLETPNVHVSEVTSGLDGASLKDVLRGVTSVSDVHDWDVPVVGTVGSGDVSIGVVKPERAHDHNIVSHRRLSFLDAAVSDFRKENGHDRGLLAQAGGVKRDTSAPLGATFATKGPEKDEAPGLMQRMRSLIGGREDR
jgi:hypothetical protein